MIRVFSGETADQVWQEAARAVLGGPSQGGRGGDTTECLHAALSLTNPLARWVSIRTPPLNPAFPLVEVVWILSGRRDAGMLTFWNSKLPEYVGTATELHGAYGWRLRKHFGIDQISRAVHALRADSASRQVVLQIWDPREDLPTDLGAPANRDIPCNTSSHLKVRGGQLEWLQVMRSNDLYRGTPYNLVQFTVLHELIAGWLDVELGHYDLVVDSLHVYADAAADVTRSVNSNDDLKEQPPRFAVPLSVWPSTLRALETILESLLAAPSEDSLIKVLAEAGNLPADWPSAVAIIAADAARRKKLSRALLTAEASCSNPLLRRLWDRWYVSQTNPKKHPGVASA